MNAYIVESNLAKVLGSIDYSSIQPSQGLPAIWIVVDEEDWSGMNDCGVIYLPEQNADSSRHYVDSINDDWPIESCS